jgi:hypothetical protein
MRLLIELLGTLYLYLYILYLFFCVFFGMLRSSGSFRSYLSISPFLLRIPSGGVKVGRVTRFYPGCVLGVHLTGGASDI